MELGFRLFLNCQTINNKDCKWDYLVEILLLCGKINMLGCVLEIQDFDYDINNSWYSISENVAEIADHISPP